MAMNVIDRESLLGMVASPLIWAAHFLLCYTLVGVACAFGFASPAPGEWGIIRISLIIVSILALATIAGLAFLAHRRWRQSGASRRPQDAEQSRHRFMSVAALLLSILSGIGVAYTAVPLFVLSTCR